MRDEEFTSSHVGQVRFKALEETGSCSFCSDFFTINQSHLDLALPSILFKTLGDYLYFD